MSDYASDIAKYTSNVDQKAVDAIVKHLGIALKSKDASNVAISSKSEIEQVLDMGVDPARIIYAQPCKTNSYVRYVANQGVRQMTFDNADELYKTKQLFPEAELFLRILTDDSASLCRLSQKFGASLDATAELLELAKKLSDHATSDRRTAEPPRRTRGRTSP